MLGEIPLFGPGAGSAASAGMTEVGSGYGGEKATGMTGEGVGYDGLGMGRRRSEGAHHGGAVDYVVCVGVVVVGPGF